MSITDKFSKAVDFISDKITWNDVQWVIRLLNHLTLMNWGLLKAILTDRDLKFVTDIWKKIFEQLKVKSLLLTVYHSQTDESSEIINQTAEISLQYFLMTLKDINCWVTVLLRMQAALNNSTKYFSINKTLTEVLYDFWTCEALNLLWVNEHIESEDKAVSRETQDANSADLMMMMTEYRLTAVDVKNIIAFAVIQMKEYYNNRHKLKFFKVSNMINLQLHQRYTILSIQNKKIEQQFVSSFRVKERIEHLIYRLELPSHWWIHNIISIAHLKDAITADLYNWSKSDHSSSVTVDSDINHYKIDKLLRKRTRCSEHRECEIITEYLIQWKRYSSKHDI